MQFFRENCNKVGPSVGMPLTTNDIAFQVVNASQGGTVPDGTSGLVAISAVAPDGFSNIPLESPIHSRVYTFSSLDGTSRVFEPIILDTAEFPGNPHTWSPMRTAATFFSPLVTPVVRTALILICPKSTIQGDADAYFGGPVGTPPGPFSTSGFPWIDPRFPTGRPVAPHAIRVRIYDTNEIFKRNTFTSCICFTQHSLEDGTLDPIYSNAAEVPFGTYTELEEDPALPTSTFTGYSFVFTVGSGVNNFFGRLSNGSRRRFRARLPANAR